LTIWYQKWIGIYWNLFIMPPHNGDGIKRATDDGTTVDKTNRRNKRPFAKDRGRKSQQEDP
jgi:hypothetical protein